MQFAKAWIYQNRLFGVDLSASSYLKSQNECRGSGWMEEAQHIRQGTTQAKNTDGFTQVVQKQIFLDYNQYPLTINNTKKWILLSFFNRSLSYIL